MGDSSKRRAYDTSRQEEDAQANADGPNVTKPTNTTQWRWQSSPRPASRPEYHTGARSQSYTKRQAWLKYEKATEAAIRQYREYVHALQTEIASLAAKITKLERDFAINAQWPADGISDPIELQRLILEVEAVMKAKKQQLKHDEIRLGRLEVDLIKRRAQEYTRLAAERKDERQREEREEQLRQETLARARLEAEARKQREEAWEARMREMQQRAKQFAAMQAGLADEARRAEAAKLKRIAEERIAEREARAMSLEEKMKSKAEVEKRCRHETSWERHTGPFDCTYCAWPPSTFAYQCPDCLVLACIFCMTTLKAGCEPADYKSFWKNHTSAHAEAPASHVDEEDDFDDDYYDCKDDFDDGSDNEYFDCVDYKEEDCDND